MAMSVRGRAGNGTAALLRDVSDVSGTLAEEKDAGGVMTAGVMTGGVGITGAGIGGRLTGGRLTVGKLTGGAFFAG
jgi:hypothetical protein